MRQMMSAQNKGTASRKARENRWMGRAAVQGVGVVVAVVVVDGRESEGDKWRLIRALKGPPLSRW